MMSLRGKRVLVTGGTGFLGSHLVRRLITLGAQVSVFRADLANRTDVIRVVQQAQPSVIFHLAAAGVDPTQSDAEQIVRVNVLGLIYLLEALAAVPYERLVNTGTCFEYAPQRSALTEQHPLSPLNEYAASKTASWHVCNLHVRRWGKPIVTLRPFTFFGPGERADRLITSTIRSILRGEEIRVTSGAQTRDYTYVEDVVEAYLLAGTSERTVGQTFNIGTGIDYTVREIVERIRRIMNSDAPIRVGALPTRDDEVWRLCCDPAKAKALMGWQPRIAFDEGLRRTVEWMRDSGPLRRAEDRLVAMMPDREPRGGPS